MDASSEQLAAIGRKLRAAGDVGIRRETTATLRAAARPLAVFLQDSARASLPKAGKMNTFVARRRPRVVARTGVRTYGVSLQYRGKGAPSDKGPWRHPVFGNREKWVSQEYAPAEGWWERGEAEGTPAAEAAMRLVLAKVAAQVKL